MKTWFAIAFLALTGGAPAAEIEGLPKAGASPHFTLVQPQEKTLANGLRVIVIERPGLPIVSVRMLVKAGAETDPPRFAGLGNFTATMLTSGTTGMTAPQFAQAIDALGAKIETEIGWDFTSAKLTTLSSNAAPALALLAEATRRPAFAPPEIERTRRQLFDDLRLSLEEPSTIARLVARRTALGGSPYAHAAKGTLASLARITRSDLVALHQRNFRPENTILVFAGNLTAEQAFQLAENSFGNWKSEKSQSPPKPDSISSPAPRIVLVDMPNAGQAAVFLGQPNIARNDADYFAAKVCNCVLGGGYSSRLNEEVRVKRGLSYGAGSSLDPLRTTGLFLASAQTKESSAVEVARVMQAEVQRLSTEPVDGAYLDSRKATLTGAFARDCETNEGYTKRFGELALYGLPLGSLNHYADDIGKISPADVSQFATTHLPASALGISIVGSAKEIAPQLQALFSNAEVIPKSQLDLDAPSLRKSARNAN